MQSVSCQSLFFATCKNVEAELITAFETGLDAEPLYKLSLPAF